jgi:hypothetical protein
MDDKEIIRSALRTWGIQHQAVVAIEEMSELQKELCKLMRGLIDLNHIAEEVADVEIMLAQIKEAYNLYHSVDTHRYFKLQRLDARIAFEQKERQNGQA